MIIKSIEINDFLSYYGKTEFSFGKGASIIIGQNNTGKSKLFDAYNWVLYDVAFMTEAENWEDTSKWKDKLVNRLARKECSIGQKVEVSVCLEFEDEDTNHFLVTREYTIIKLSDDEWNCPPFSDLQLTKKEAGTYNTLNFSGENARIELERYYPKNLSRYFLFQGENISRLMRLNQRSDFTKAIGELSGIKYFAKAKRYAQKVYEKAEYEFENKGEKDEKIQKEKERLIREIDDLKEKLGDIEFKLENEYKERDKKETLLNNKTEELSRYEECAKLLQEINEIEKQVEFNVKEQKLLFKNQRSSLFSSWIYGNSKNQFQDFLQMYRKGKDEKKIPEPIRQDFIQEMLDAYICKICGTEAPLGSTEYANIMSYLNDQALDKEVALINTLSDTADTMFISINQLPIETNSFKTALTEVQSERTKLRSMKEQREDELRIVVERIADDQKTDVSSTRKRVEGINIKQVKLDRDQYDDDLKKSKSKIDQFLGKRDAVEENLKSKENDYNNLIDRSSNEHEKNKVKLAGEILNEVGKLHDDFKGKLMGDIEKETNTYFESMTRNNSALSGSIKVDYHNEEVYPVDENGNRMTNINQANKVSLQISFVAAVLSVSNRIWERYFPFVSDAAISALGGNNKISAIKTMVDIFQQSIIILKDDADTNSEESIRNDQIRELIKVNDKIQSAYELRMARNKSIEGQHTITTKLK